MTYMKNKTVKGASQIEIDSTTISNLSSQTQETFIKRNFPNELQENFEKYDQNITDFVKNKLLNIYAEFQLAWANDVKNILNLYKVKYDPKNVSSR